VPDGGDGSSVGLAQQGLELGEHHLDGVEVGAIRRQEQQVRAGVTNGSPNRATFVAAKIVENDDVARAQRRDQELLHPSQEQLAVDRAVKDARRHDTLGAQAGDERHRRPTRMRSCGHQASATPCPTMGARHIRLCPGLVDEHQPAGRDQSLIAPPEQPLTGNVSAILLARRLFLKVRRAWRTKRQTAS
jgi:hypothetical protein